MVNDALQDVPPTNIAERALILAALQVDFARHAAMLAPEDLRPIADGICPVLGSAPMTSSVVGWPKAHNTRFCACSLCGTMWNMAVCRIKCVLCTSEEGISYLSIEGQPDTVKAETCDKCQRYVKILYQVKDHLLDPLSDDVERSGSTFFSANRVGGAADKDPIAGVLICTTVLASTMLAKRFLFGRTRLPSVDHVLRSEIGMIAVARFGHDMAVRAIRQTLTYAVAKRFARRSCGSSTGYGDNRSGSASHRGRRRRSKPSPGV